MGRATHCSATCPKCSCRSVTSATFRGCPERTRSTSIALETRRHKLHENSTFSGRSTLQRIGNDQNSRTMKHRSAAKLRSSLTPLVERTNLSLRIHAQKIVRGLYPDRVDWNRARKRDGEITCMAIETPTSHPMVRTRTSQAVLEKPLARRTLMRATAALTCRIRNLEQLPPINPSPKFMSATPSLDYR